VQELTRLVAYQNIVPLISLLMTFGPKSNYFWKLADHANNSKCLLPLDTKELKCGVCHETRDSRKTRRSFGRLLGTGTTFEGKYKK
jgi:hypothetical protein